jgi:hypothetical protein
MWATSLRFWCTDSPVFPFICYLAGSLFGNGRLAALGVSKRHRLALAIDFARVLLYRR